MLIYHFVVIVKWLTIIPEKPSTAMIWVVQTLLIFHFGLNVFCDQINWLHMDVGLSCQLWRRLWKLSGATLSRDCNFWFTNKNPIWIKITLHHFTTIGLTNLKNPHNYSFVTITTHIKLIVSTTGAVSSMKKIWHTNSKKNSCSADNFTLDYS